MDGGTTVSGTMVVSALAGIEVFVTGGIGGVHRGGAQSLDISAGGQHYHRMFMKIGTRKIAVDQPWIFRHTGRCSTP